MALCKSTLFGQGSQYIKVGNGEFIAIEGSNTFDRLMVSDSRMPYKQLLKGRVILKKGQVNYLLNHLGLGDNATFLAIKATYDSKSVVPDDNYVNYSYYDYPIKSYHFAQMMVLTGNISHRIPQLYLTNPSVKYPVILDIMVGIIDDEYSFFNDTLNQSATSFTQLEYTKIKSYVVGESIKIVDADDRPLVYLALVNINSIEKIGTILVVDDSSLGTIFLSFVTQNDCNQAHSLLNYVLENPMVDISTISPLEDTTDPVVYFYSTAGATGSYISFNGATAGVPYDTTDGFTFSTSISLSTSGTVSGTVSIFNKQSLIDLLIDYVDDNRDGLMLIQPSNLIITGTAGEVSQISQSGTYSITFNFTDLAENALDGVVINIDIFN